MHYQDLENCRDILWKRRNITHQALVKLANYLLRGKNMQCKLMCLFVCFYQNNYLVFMAELFWWFEVVKPPFVQPQVLDTEGKLIFQCIS